MVHHAPARDTDGSAGSAPQPRWLALRRPMSLAVSFALLAIPVVTIALLIAPDSTERVNLRPLAAVEALILASIATLSAAAVGGWVGGTQVRRKPTLGTLAAIAIAWPIGVAMLPMAASVLGIRLEILEFCLDGCNPLIRSDVPASGATAYALSAMFSALFVVPLAAGGLLLIGARRLNRRGAAMPAALFVVLAYGALHVMMFQGGRVTSLPFAALAVGVVAWSVILQRDNARHADSAA